MPNVFTVLRTGGISVSRVRRVAHSAGDYLKNTIRNPFSSGATAATTVLSSVGNAAQVTQGVTGAGVMIAGATSVFAHAGFVVAVGGPQVAVAAAVVGLVVLARSAYSNRDAAHVALAPFVWNLVDYEAPTYQSPTAAQLDVACSAAMTLLEDGKNQIGLMQTKLMASGTEFGTFCNSLDNKFGVFWQLLGDLNKTYNMHHLPNREARILWLRQNVNQAATAWLQLYATGTSAGGAAYNYVRRVVHAGNYIQAGNLVALSMKMAYCAGASSIKGDFFVGCQAATDARNRFADLAAQWYQNEYWCRDWDTL